MSSGIKQAVLFPPSGPRRHASGHARLAPWAAFFTASRLLWAAFIVLCTEKFLTLDKLRAGLPATSARSGHPAAIGSLQSGCLWPGQTRNRLAISIKIFA